MTATKYVECDKSEIPAGVRFDTPRSNQGQIVEVSYGGFGAAEHDDGDPYMRRTDTSIPTGKPGRVTYYKLAD
jgi:hypothetical protein